MEKIFKWCSVTLVGVLLALGVVSTLVVPVMATGDEDVSDVAEKEVAPTFVVEADESEGVARFWMGKNLLIVGNNIKAETNAADGLVLAFGNTLDLASESEYGVVAANTVNYAGKTARDLFIAGNYVTLREEAKIGRDVYTASDTLIVETDLDGDLSATASTVELRDVEIAGNVNLSADRIEFKGNVKIAGALTYNETARVSGIERVTYGSLEAYEVAEVDPATQIVVSIYSKIMSIAALFIVMTLICAIYPKLHEKVATETDVNHFGIDLALGLGVLIVVPVVALLAFVSFVVAPLGIVALALYAVMIYLSQGFAGLWLGHLIMEKVFKAKGNIFAEAFIGVLVLGLLALIPYIGTITGFLGLLLGLGLILQWIKPAKAEASKVSAKFENKGKK